MPGLRTARENARLEIGSQRGRNSHQIGVLGIDGLQGLSYGRTDAPSSRSPASQQQGSTHQLNPATTQ